MLLEYHSLCTLGNSGGRGINPQGWEIPCALYIKFINCIPTNLSLLLECDRARGKVELRRFNELCEPTQTVHHHNTLATLQVTSKRTHKKNDTTSRTHVGGGSN